MQKKVRETHAGKWESHNIPFVDKSQIIDSRTLTGMEGTLIGQKFSGFCWSPFLKNKITSANFQSGESLLEIRDYSEACSVVSGALI